MKKTLSIFSLLLLLTGIAAGDDVAKMRDAFNKKDYKTAEIYARKALDADPSNNDLKFWYGHLLQQNGKHTEALKVLETITPDYSPLKTAVKIAVSYDALEDEEKVLSWCRKAVQATCSDLSQEKNLRGWAWYRFITAAVKTGSDDDVARYEADAVSYCEKTGYAHVGTLRGALAWYWQERGIEAALSDTTKERAYFEKALGYSEKDMGGYEQYRATLNDTLPQMAEAARVWNGASDHDRRKAMQHRIHLVIIPRMKGSWEDADGLRKRGSFTIDPEVEKNVRQSLAVMRQLLWLYTEGKVHITVESTMLDTAVTSVGYMKWHSARDGNGKALESVDVYIADLNSLSPFPYEFFQRSESEVDTWIFIYPFGKTIGIGGPDDLPLVPYTLTTARRGIVSLGVADSQATPRWFLHEFFHNVEAQYSDSYGFIQHVYKPSFRRHWPSWYKGEGELTYYRRAFQEVINPKGYEPLAFTRKKRSIAAGHIGKVRELYDQNSSGAARAWQLKREGDKLYRADTSGSRARAYNKYLETRRAYRWMVPVNDILMRYHHDRKEYRQALACLEDAAVVDPSPPFRQEWLGYLYEKTGASEKALIHYRKAYEMTGKPKFLFQQARIHSDLSQRDQSLKMYEAYLEKGDDDTLRQYALNNLSFYYTHNEATRCTERALALAEQYYPIVKEKKLQADIAFNSAVAASLRGEKSKALQWLKKAEAAGYSNRSNLDYYYNKNR